MHTLFLLTAVLSSLSPEVDASLPPLLEAVPSLTLPGSQSGKRHLLDTRLQDKGGDDGKTRRVIVECLGGFGLETVGAGLGLLVLSESSSVEAAVLAISLMALGSSAGVTLTGWAMDGRGRFGYALLGGFIGMVVPFLGGLGLLLAEGCNPDTLTNCSALVPMVLGVLLLPTVGAAIGYELSAPTPWLDLGYASSAPPPPPRLVPVLTLARQGLGVTLGVAGRL